MQAIPDLHILDLAEPSVDMQQHVVEDLLVGALVQAQVVVHFRRPHQRPDLLADGGQFGRIQRRDIRVLIQQLLQTRDVPVGFGARHGRNEVIDKGRVSAPFGLSALPRVVDQERIDQRQIADRGIGGTIC
ncbi:Uncharacterised protein [Mycobacteroides abscessus subsp. massiliense]|nr:Uncharacterised protein [Mycobacteroides abscessus subsp. massiliense]